MIQFRISDTFTDSLAKSPHDSQKSVKTTVFDLQMNPANPGGEFPQTRWSKRPNPHCEGCVMTEPQQFLIYQSENGSTRIDVMLEAETLWLNQRQLTELLGKAKGTISEHIKHIFEDGELLPEATVRLFRTVQIPE